MRASAVEYVPNLSRPSQQLTSQRLGTAVLAFIFIYYFFYDISWTPPPVAYTAVIPCEAEE